MDGELTLRFQREWSQFNNEFGDISTSEGRDTGVWVIHPNKLIDHTLADQFFEMIPGEIAFLDTEADFTTLQLYDFTPSAQNKFNQRMITAYDEWVTISSLAECKYVFDLPFERFILNQFYLEGMGGGYTNTHTAHSSILREPVYVKTKEIEWGTPLDFVVHAPETVSETAFKLFPNPTNNILHIEMRGTAIQGHFEVYQSNGSMMHAGVLQPYTSLDVSKWANGIYIVQVITPQNSFSNRFVAAK